MDDECDHLYDARFCDRCGKYQGMVCEHCGDWYDGGDHMAAQPEIWCACGSDPEEAEEEPSDPIYNLG